jgi:hypothetical protein
LKATPLGLPLKDQFVKVPIHVFQPVAKTLIDPIVSPLSRVLKLP